MRAASRGEIDRQLNRLDHGTGVGGVFSRYVEGSPVIGAGADEGQADGDVDGLIAREQFHRNQALIVIHGDDEIESAGEGSLSAPVATRRAGRGRGRYDPPVAAVGAPRPRSETDGSTRA